MIFFSRPAAQGGDFLESKVTVYILRCSNVQWLVVANKGDVAGGILFTGANQRPDFFYQCILIKVQHLQQPFFAAEKVGRNLYSCSSDSFK